MKKSTNWITIPEEKIHTPASDKDKKKGKSDVKNKFLWGIGFVVMVVVAFALLAPDQFNALLKGSLFDTSGVTEEQMKISLVPSSSTTSTETSSEETTSTDTTSTSGSTTSTSSATTSSTESTVQPEEKAVSISVTPITTTETTTETTSTETTTATDCGTDITCFLSYLTDCTLSTVTHSYKVSDEDFEADLEITGTDNTDCTLTAEFTKSPESDLVGENMTCTLAQGTYTQTQFEKILSDKDELEKSCTGDAADTLGTYLDSLTAAETTTTATTTSDSQAVEDLKKQLEALTKIVADQQTKPAAATTTTAETTTTTTPTTTTATTTTTPTSVTTTTAIGQPSAVTAGFAANTHTVSVTPEQMLKQNKASGVTYSTAATTTTAASSYQTTTTASTTTTPQTGPSEVILIAFIITFLALLGWKFVRTFA